MTEMPVKLIDTIPWILGMVSSPLPQYFS